MFWHSDSNFLLYFLSHTVTLVCAPSNILLANMSHDNICSCTSFISDESFIAPSASLMTSCITSHQSKFPSQKNKFLSKHRIKKSTSAHVREVNVNLFFIPSTLQIDWCMCWNNTSFSPQMASKRSVGCLCFSKCSSQRISVWFF